MKRSAPVLVRADGTRVELAGYDICIRVPPLVSHVSYSPAGVRLSVSLSKGEWIEDRDRVVYPDATFTESGERSVTARTERLVLALEREGAANG